VRTSSLRRDLHDDAKSVSEGFTAVKPYLRYTPQPTLSRPNGPVGDLGERRRGLRRLFLTVPIMHRGGDVRSVGASDRGSNRSGNVRGLPASSRTRSSTRSRPSRFWHGGGRDSADTGVGAIAGGAYACTAACPWARYAHGRRSNPFVRRRVESTRRAHLLGIAAVLRTAVRGADVASAGATGRACQPEVNVIEARRRPRGDRSPPVSRTSPDRRRLAVERRPQRGRELVLSLICRPWSVSGVTRRSFPRSCATREAPGSALPSCFAAVASSSAAPPYAKGPGASVSGRAADRRASEVNRRR